MIKKKNLKDVPERNRRQLARAFEQHMAWIRQTLAEKNDAEGSPKESQDGDSSPAADNEK